MRCWAFNLAAATSLALCIGTAALWVRSFFRFDSFGWHDAPDCGFQVSSSTGEFFVVRLIHLRPDMWGSGWSSYPISPELRHARRVGTTLLGFQYYSAWLPFGTGEVLVGVPYWAVLVVFALAPTVAVAKRLRSSRWSFRGRCAKCGYDLRATPGRCPECGTVPTGDLKRGQE